MGFKGNYRKLALYLAVWSIMRAMMVVQLYLRSTGGRNGGGVDYEDLYVFLEWAQQITESHQVPVDTAWQYPPGAIYIFLLPLALSIFQLQAFIVMFLVADLAIALALASLSFRSGTSAGIWIWILVIPALGRLPLLRFDMIPTAFAVTGLVLPPWRWRNQVVGFLIGMGVAAKAWPIVLLLSVGSRKEIRTVLLAAGATILFVILTTSLWLDGTLNFLVNQSGRGLQIESVAASPWYVRQAVIGHGVPWTGGRNGAPEIASLWADLIASLLRIAMAFLGVACVVWWLLWTRDETSIDPERRTAIGRDAVFTAILLYIVISPVLSPQYLIWAVGIGAVAVCSRHSLVRRPVAAVAISVLLTQTLLAMWGDLVNNGAGGAYMLVVRNLVLVFAALDAAWTMLQVTWSPGYFFNGSAKVQSDDYSYGAPHEA